MVDPMSIFFMLIIDQRANIFFMEFPLFSLQDYGITERGGKTNLGQPELNTSSIGMAKVRWVFKANCV